MVQKKNLGGEKKKKLKKTRRRQRGGDITQDILIYMGIFGTCMLGVAVWSTLEWGGRHVYNLGEGILGAASSPILDDEQKRRDWQESHSAGGEGVTEESASVALDRVYGYE